MDYTVSDGDDGMECVNFDSPPCDYATTTGNSGTKNQVLGCFYFQDDKYNSDNEWEYWMDGYQDGYWLFECSKETFVNATGDEVTIQSLTAQRFAFEGCTGSVLNSLNLLGFFGDSSDDYDIVTCSNINDNAANTISRGIMVISSFCIMVTILQ